ncbi:hypothetical protein J4427_00390 [Candidatus Woesearchaeota archaeon]|nr:hypothetical protein [Candidatus Woesearchaeota archaeon]
MNERLKTWLAIGSFLLMSHAAYDLAIPREEYKWLNKIEYEQKCRGSPEHADYLKTEIADLLELSLGAMFLTWAYRKPKDYWNIKN